MRLWIISLVMVAAATTLAQDAPKERWQFKTLTARLAVQHYQARMDKATALYDTEATKAREWLATELAKAQEQATKAGNLEEALAMKAAIEEIESEQPTAPAPAPARGDGKPAAAGGAEGLNAKLKGTRWAIQDSWYGDKGWVQLNKDHTLVTGFHGGGGMWAAVDSRTVRLTMWEERSAVAVWVVDEKASRAENPSAKSDKGRQIRRIK